MIYQLRWWALTGICALTIAGSPTALMLTGGRQPSSGQFDAAVVFGARVYEDGTLSDALDDRIVAACALYNDGRCAAIIVSGGPGDGPISESEAMRLRAMELGVPDSVIILDCYGLDTRATAENAAGICADRGWMRVVAVTHFYHGPRAEMMLRRAGLDADAEPASMRNGMLGGLGYYLARECAAWWVDRLRLR